MLSRTSRSTALVASALSLAALGAGGTVALAATSGSDAPTTVDVTTAPALGVGDKAPFDVPGVKAIRRGQAIPAGYTLVGYHITVHRGAKMAGAALRFSCPSGQKLASFAVTGRAGFSATGKYWDHNTAWVMSTPGMRAADGSALTAAEGNLYAICK
jgi:hypothetical protein